MTGDIEKKCRNCLYYVDGLTEEQKHKWSYSNFGSHATGICTLYFPRGYIARKPPHPAMADGHCFLWTEAVTKEQVFSRIDAVTKEELFSMIDKVMAYTKDADPLIRMLEEDGTE